MSVHVWGHLIFFPAGCQPIPFAVPYLQSTSSFPSPLVCCSLSSLPKPLPLLTYNPPAHSLCPLVCCTLQFPSACCCVENPVLCALAVSPLPSEFPECFSPNSPYAVFRFCFVLEDPFNVLSFITFLSMVFGYCVKLNFSPHPDCTPAWW